MTRFLLLVALLALASAGSQVAAAQESGDGFFGMMEDEDALNAFARTSATLPAGFYLETVASGLNVPVNVEFATTGMAMVAEKQGVLYAIENGTRRQLLDLRTEVLNQGDRGLLGIAFDPSFAANGYIYLLYAVSVDGADTQRTDAFARLTRYTIGADGNVILSSRTILIGETFSSGIPSCYYSHTIGTLAFGSDGSLLVGTGDAASYSARDTGGLYANCFGPGKFPVSEDVGAFRSVMVESLAGKILRIDPATGLGLPSNPFYTGIAADNASRVWAMGFRNPYRFSVDPTTGSANPADGNPGVIHYADVGWKLWEEVGVVRKGENHGWPCREGLLVQGDYSNSPSYASFCSGATFADPTYSWHHHVASTSTPPGRIARAAVGGSVYSGTRYPADYRNRAYYADYPIGWLASSAVGPTGALTDEQLFSSDTGPIVDIQYDPQTQTLNLVNVVAGTVQRLRHTSEPGNATPVAQAGGAPTQGGIPLVVQFSGSGSFDPDGDGLAYNWAFDDGTTSALADPTHTYTSAGTFNAVLTVTDGFGASANASVTITARDGSPPTAAITSPSEGASVQSGQTITLAVSATDPDQSAASLSYAWDVTLVHDDHTHPNAFSASGASVAYTVPFHGADDEYYSLLVKVTVTDEDGLIGTDERLVPIGTSGEIDVTPQGTPIALITAPTGQGSPSLDVIKDGVRPLPTTNPTDPLLQYDTFDGGDPRPIDWIGYSFASPITFGRLRLTEGIHFPAGGWFETIDVQVRQGDQWVDATNVVVAPAYRGDDGRAFDAYDIAFLPLTGNAIRLIGAPGGSGEFISVAELRAFSSGTGGNGPLPTGWTSADIGNTPVPGSAGYAEGTFTVRGGGDIWGDFDGFQYVSKSLTGDGTITARLTSLAGAHPWAKAGVMIRSGSEGDAPHAMLIGTASNGVHLQYRLSSGDDTQWQIGPNNILPTWVRLQRTGNVLTGFTSVDGQTWSVVGSATIAMGPTVSVGLISTATDYGDRLDLAAATFTDVSVTTDAGGGPLPNPLATDVGSPGVPGSTARDGETFTVTGSGDVWGDNDAFHFASWTLDGDGSLTALMPGVNSPNGWAKAGVMIRGGLGSNAVSGFALVSPQNGMHLQYRTAAGADIDWIAGDYSQAAPVWLRVRRLGDNVTAEHSADGADWTSMGTVTLPLGQIARIGLAVTSSDISNDGHSATAVFTNVALSDDGTGDGPTLPEGWVSRDIGNVGVAGQSGYANTRFTVTGNGDLYGDFDGFQYAYQTLPGDAVITARLDSLTATNPWAKAGLMVRAGTDGAAPYLSLTGTPGRGVHVQYRTNAGQEAEWVAYDYGQVVPVWLRLQRSGDIVAAFTSTDGATWTPVTSAAITLPADALVGLVSTSTDYESRNDFARAVFSNVSLGGSAALAPNPEAASQLAPPAFEIKSVFPNPATDRAQIRIGVSEAGFYRIDVVDLLGRSVYEHTLREDAPAVRDLDVDLTGRSAGIYILRVSQEGGATVIGRLTVVR